MKNFRHGFASIILILIVVVIFCGLYFYFKKERNIEDVQTIQTTTSDLKTYTNTQYGFSLKYPSNWQINKETYSSFGIVDLVDNAYKPNALKGNKFVMEKIFENVAENVEWTNYGQTGWQKIVYLKNQKIGVHLWATDSTNKDIEDEMVSSIEFK
jgi:hypothetical protein